MAAVATLGPKVLVAMSGGVDSSVAAAMLVRQGYDVVGAFMRLGSPGEDLNGAAGGKIGHQGCCSINDANDARQVASALGVPFYVLNFKREFGRVIDYFADEYARGRTPNPCVRCNDWLKFGRLHATAKQIGAAAIASGHYARIRHGGTEARRHDGTASPAGAAGATRLLRGVDKSKDQSYVLFGAPAARLAEMLLPIGDYPKEQVRDMAKAWGLPVFDKPDSQEICFVPDNDYAGLVERIRPGLAGAVADSASEPRASARAGSTPGAIVDAHTGAVVGSHRGQHRFTIGQRRGLSVSLGHPIYVVGRDAATNTVTVGPREALASAGLEAREVNWLVDAPGAPGAPGPDEWRECLVKIRYNAEPVAARCRVDVARDSLEVRFEAAQHAVAPGQAAVCYDASEPDLVLGGGWIDRVMKRDA